MKEGCGGQPKTKTQAQTLVRFIALIEKLTIELLTDPIKVP
jgi:hypothetical protein